MPLCTEVDNVLQLLDQVQALMTGGGRLESSDPKLLSQVNNDLNTLLSVLSNPVFNRLCKIQDSVAELGTQIGRHPSVTTNDFDITPEGKLVLKISPAAEPFTRDFDKTPIGGKPIVPVPATKSSNLQQPSKFPEEQPLTPITTPTYVQEFERVIQEASHGREIHSIRLFKPEGSSLGFSVVGLKSQEKGELGIFIQEIQPTGIAASYPRS
ncbi:unnamed protein product [Allacma fusca]|uniref:Uncharacterized protein n=1 Tax=Allacma fusca TaxID=39272 RepID=A0A8J2JK17_9HEXA|nr:unnamed protein product [Allacma fusca]